MFDNLETGALENIRDHIQLGKINFIQSDIRDFKSCLSATINCDVVFHQAALGSVPRSIQKPLETHATNVDGFINMLEACKQNNVNDLFTLLLLLFMALIKKVLLTSKTRPITPQTCMAPQKKRTN